MSEQEKPAVIGLDVGGTNITGGLIDGQDQIVARHKLDTDADEGPEHVVDRIGQCIAELIDESDYDTGSIAGVGLGVPGAVDVANGLVLEAPNLRWNHMPVVKEMSKRTDLAVTLDNDVNVGSWGEFRVGAGRGQRSMFGIFVGTGIGGGLIFDEYLFHGPYGTAGEIGHVLVDAHGPVGLRTLEQLASRTAIVNRLVQMIQANQPSQLPEIAGKKWPDNIRSKPLAKALAADDALTIAVMRDAASAIGIAIANTVTLLSLDCVVVGGGLTEALDERWMSWIRESFEVHVFPERCAKCQVLPSKLGDDAGLLGAALLARERLSGEAT